MPFIINGILPPEGWEIVGNEHYIVKSYWEVRTKKKRLIEDDPELKDAFI